MTENQKEDRESEVRQMIDCGLILEGGGMRGLYTTGVLDFFLDKGLEFSACYGVSAGSANGCNFISKQRKRNFQVNTDYLEDKNYASIYSLLTTGNFFGTEMCYHKVPVELNPFDFETFRAYKGEFYAVVTDCETGQPQYLRVQDMHKDMEKIRASCSLPLMAEMVKIDGHLYLDGGLSDSIPVRQSVKDGHPKNVVILTRDLEYRKKPSELLPVIRLKYSRYPKLVEAMERRHMVYNRTLEYIRNQEKKGNLFVIRPSRPVKIGRLEKNKEKLTKLYKQGYRDAVAAYDGLKEFLENL